MTKSQRENTYTFASKYKRNREKYWRPKIYQELLDMIKAAGNYPSPEIMLQMLNVSIPKLGIASVLRKVYIDAGRVMGGYAYQGLKQRAKEKQKARLMPMEQNQELVNDIIAYYDKYLLEKAVLPITDTMREWIRVQVMDGVRQGYSVSTIVRMMLQHPFPKNRANVIARTEVQSATNFGAVEGAKKTGIPYRKVWISSLSDRTRRIPRDQFDHLTMDGVTVGQDEAFAIPMKTGGVEMLLQPGDKAGSAANVIQCRCTVGFEPID